MRSEITDTPDTPQVLVLPPILVGGALLLGIVIDWIHPIPVLPLVLARVIGVIIFVLSGVLAHFAQTAMHRAGTNIRPDRPALALVTDGPFRFTRNPLYVAAIGVYLGIALFVNGLVPLLLVIPVFYMLHRGVVLREERYMEGKFGEPFRVYRSSVRRWL
ncbi:MAG: isoprenylcysteine carboxylmethyltransferase family protein [Gemmatimonadota bacterium]|nr:isoprenylcysteine carboxylmethyltransferase family protein [Gemmatimonadota bacterium]